jgi:hypothetical protein
VNDGASGKLNGKLSVGCFNSQSMCNKVTGVLEMMKDKHVDICCVTETWFKAKENARFAEIHDFGFDVISAPRRGHGGGVAFVYNPNIVKPVRNNTKNFKSFEVVECIIKSCDGLIRLCVVYRSTQTKSKEKYEDTKVTHFFEEFDQYLETLIGKAGTPFICGDFNFHIEDKTNSYAKRFIAIYESKGFTQHVTAPTHKSGGTLDLVLSSKAVTDNIPVQNITVDSISGTSSDHYLVRFQLPVMLDSNNKTQQNFEEKEIRELSKINIDEFRGDLFCSDLNFSEFEGVDQAVQLFQQVVEDVLDKHAPLVTKKFNTKRSPWWDSKCQEAKSEMRKAQRKVKKFPNDAEAKDNFKEKCIDKAIIVNRSRNRYYDEKLSAVKGDSRGTYKLINHLLDKEYGTNKLPNGVSDKETAENLQNFFNQKVKNIYSGIEKELKNTTSTFNSDMGPNSDTMCQDFELSKFHEIEIDELENIIRELPNKSSDLDVIPMWLFKNCLPELISIVHYIVNESLKTGQFPSQLKFATVKPGLKKPNLDVDELNNYRPISNLTYLSKLLEKVVHKQLVNYATENKLFANFQSGYRKFHSCETAVTKIHNDILVMSDKQENVVLLLLDLSAAFDTINHDILLSKLKRTYGVKGEVLEWLKSYLSNRKFKVVVKNCSSSGCTLEIGVPQGSILGPLLFILYTRDLESIVTKYGFTIHFYADDTQVYFSFNVHSSNPDLSRIKECFGEIKKWMTSNYLKLNDGKTEFIDIGYYVSPIKSLDLGEVSAEPVDKAKNLGFIFDHQMNLNNHIDSVSQICYLNLRNLKRIAARLSYDLKVQLVHSNILSHIDYCNSVFGGLTEKNLFKLQKMQNNAVRFIFGLYGKQRRVSIKPLLKKLHFLPVKYRIMFKVSMLVFKCLNNFAPEYLANLITLREVNKRSSRLDDDYCLLKTPKASKFTRTEAAFTYYAPTIWNELPYSIRSLTDTELFKKTLKSHFFDIAFEGI